MLTLVAAVLGAEGNTLEIDKGLAHGLRRGDRGTVFYQLTVASELRRIELGPVEITSLGIERAVASVPERGAARPGFKVEFEVEPERLSPANIVSAVREQLGETAAAELAHRYVEELSGLADADEEAASDVVPPALPHDGMIWVPAGSYAIGMEVNDAAFFNETPRFETRLEGFWIDAIPAPARGIGFAAAREQCASLGKRLPTEFEWEVASRNREFELRGGFDWTSSFYLPYPGNRHPEAPYGEHFRVLRGSKKAASPEPTRRYYSEPAASGSDLGFRCAMSAPDNG